MGRRIRGHDWRAGPLGHMDAWPQSLLTTARMMLSSRFAMWMAWGPELTFLCNDAYRPTLGVKDAWALGSRSDEVWSEIWSDIGPRIERVLRTREATWDEGLQLFLERSGFREETYHTFSYSPLADDSGAVSGMLCVVAEETERVVGDRRLRLLRDLGVRLAGARRAADVWNALKAAVSAEPKDAPFLLGYTFADGAAKLAAASGVERGSAAAPETILPGPEAPWPLFDLAEGGGTLVGDLGTRFGDLPKGPWEQPPNAALVIPLPSPGRAEAGGALVVGLNPYRPLDTAYRGFLDLLAGQAASGLAGAGAYEAERKRAEALAELDQAKTAFFSNVSHEFRTPLTLMLGPLEEVLQSDAALTAEAVRDRIDMAHRNGLRLLRLVNTLLDFSRIEAGRVQASFAPVDLAALTADLAASFRSATDRAGLSLIVDAPPLSGPVHVDRDMWEKIVLNLLSNAFKFTFEGEIVVRLEESEGRARLTVQDTGVGIPSEELPRLFERFHRVEGTRGRSFEGSGIGLALVQELVKLHGGDIAVESTPGEGTRFTVSVPLGTAHLPQERLGAAPDAAATAVRAGAFVDEALRWLPDAEREDGLLDAGDADAEGDATTPGTRAAGRIVLADDNADLRAYIARLLSSRGYEVEAVPDGEAALAAVRAARPDLIVTDVMMPRLDGFALLQAVRADPALRDLPIVLLSARAGEEAKVEGFASGADDYLVKPFSSRELLARVAANLQTAKLRRETNAALAESEARFRNMADHAPMMMWVTDPRGRCTYANRAWTAFTGQSEEDVLGFGWIEAIHPDDRAEAQRVFLAANAAHGRFSTEYRLRRADGVWRWALNGAAPRFGSDGAFLGYVGSIIDITERRDVEAALEQRVAEEIAARGEVEEALRQAQKMEAVGQLTGGIAHDFNNLLTIITGNIGITSRALDAAGIDDPRARRALDSALKGAERAASLTHRLLAFSRRQPLSPKPTDVDKLVSGMSDLVHRALGETIALEVVTSPGLWRVEVDPNQLESALLNLAVNARDAMPHGGRLTIETANALLDDAYAAANAEAAPGQYVLVAVTDTGEGMKRETLARVFEPFFTTKDVGKGTGLGLSMVYGFTKQSGGHVKVYSEPGEGTTVKVYLPRLLSEAEGVDAAHSTEPDRARAGQSILVVEDDHDVRQYTVTILNELGYRVVEAQDGPSALRLLERRGEVIALLFTDVVMPGMSGGELAAKARELRPGLKVLFTSGYTRNAIVHGGRLDPGVEMISKPFTYQALARKVRDVLDLGATGTVLVVDGADVARTSLVQALGAAGYAVEQASTAAEGLGTVRASQGRLDAVVLGTPRDKALGSMAMELRALYADLPLLVAAAPEDEALRRRFAGDRCVGWLDASRAAEDAAAALEALGVSCRGR